MVPQSCWTAGKCILPVLPPSPPPGWQTDGEGDVIAGIFEGFSRYLTFSVISINSSGIWLILLLLSVFVQLFLLFCYSLFLSITALPLSLYQLFFSLCCSASSWLKVFKVLRASCGAMDLHLLHQEEMLGSGTSLYSSSTVSHSSGWTRCTW